MILRKGNMWTQKPDVFLFTGNSSITINKSLVMGRGAAKEAKYRFPGCDKVFGRLIHARSAYGIVTHPTQTNPMLGVFQVKYYYADLAVLSLIGYSTGLLDTLAKEDWKYKRIVMNFPGIGCGGLDRKDVLPIIQDLPNNIEIWEYA